MFSFCAKCKAENCQYIGGFFYSNSLANLPDFLMYHRCSHMVISRVDVERKFYNWLLVFPFKQKPILFGFDVLVNSRNKIDNPLNLQAAILVGKITRSLITNNKMHFDAFTP